MNWLERTLELTRRQAIALTGILGVATVARIWWLLSHAPGVESGTVDEMGYATVARQLLESGFYGYNATVPNAFTTPGYPLFVAGVFRLANALGLGGGGEFAAMRIAQMLLGIVAVWLVFLIGRRAVGVRVGLIASAVMAVYPSAFMAQQRLLTESLFTALLLGWLLLALKLRERRTWQLHAALGALLALMVLVRPTVALLGVVLYALDLAENRDWRFALNSLVALLAFCLVMSPWWIRNRVVLGETVLLATQTGNPFLRGTDPWDPYDKIGPSILEGVAEEDMQRVGAERLKAGLRDDPATYVTWYTVGKWWYLWRTPWYEATWFSKVLHWVFVVGLGWVGAIAGLFDRRVRLLALTVVVMTVTQLAFIPITRYMYPLTAVAMVLAAWVVSSAWERFEAR